jgi:hypothetical protein
VKVVPFIVTYNGMAGGPCLDRCVEHLMGGAPPSFGAAIERVDIYAHCQTRDPVNPSLASMYDRFQSRLTTLPFLRFRRKTRLFEVAYVSSLLYSEAMFRSAKTEFALADYHCVCREFAEALSLIRHRVKRSDDFDPDGLEAHLKHRIEQIE